MAELTKAQKRAVAIASARTRMAAPADDFVHPNDIATDAPPVAVNPRANPQNFMAEGMTPGAYGDNPMAQGAPAPDQTNGGGLPDQFNAFASSMFRSPDVVGPALESGMTDLKAKAQGETPEQVAADEQANRERNPIAAGTGAFVGKAIPYVLGSMFGPTSTALGLSGSVLSRLGWGGASQFGINTADNVMHGQNLGDAAKNAIWPTVASEPFALFGRGAKNVSRDAATSLLDEAGVPLTGGQRSGSKTMRFAEGELGGSAADAFNEKQAQSFTRAILNKAGVKGDRATPEVLNDAFVKIGSTFDNLAAKTTVPFDKQLQQDVGDVVFHYTQTSGMPAPIVKTMADQIEQLAKNGGGTISGEAYQNIRSKLGALSTSGDGPTRIAVRDLQSALDDAVERYMPAKFISQWKNARKQYQNLLIVQDSVKGAGPEAVSGIITPAHVRSATSNVLGTSRYTRGAGETNDLARAGVQILTPLANSNTAARSRVRNAIPYALGAGGLGYATGGWGGAGLAAAATLTPALAGRMILSGPGRALLGGTSALPNIAAKSTIGQSNSGTISLKDWFQSHQASALQ